MSKLNLSCTFPNSENSILQSVNVITTAPTHNDDMETDTLPQRESKRDNPDLNPDFRTIKLVSSIVLFILRKGWMMCSTGVFLTFIAYWCYGSWFALLLFLCGLAGLFYQISDWLLFHPDEPPHSRFYVPMPPQVGLPSDVIYLTTDDEVKIHAVFIKQQPSIVEQVPTVLFLHGNAGNIGHRLAFIMGLYCICRCNILLLEYRGYGRSEGEPSEEGLYLDAQAGLKFLLRVPFIDKSKIIVFGRSLGGAVAIDLASRPEFGKYIFALVVENTFTSIPDIAREIFGFTGIRWLPVWAYKNKFRSADKITRVKCPTLLISGERDTLIPPHMMRRLLVLCGSSIKHLQSFPTGSHNNTWKCEGYYNVFDLFLDDVLLLRGQSGQK